MADVKPIPENSPRLTPYLTVDGAAAAIDFYTSVLGAKEGGRVPGPDGKVLHAELELGNSVVMLSDHFPESGTTLPSPAGGNPINLVLYVENVDDAYDRALKAGATSVQPPEDQFYGNRSAQFIDPFGHRWNLNQHVEDVSEEEMQRRMAEMRS